MDAVIFDFDGVLVDSERLWDAARRGVVAEHGGTWIDGATAAQQGMSTPEWAHYLVTELGTELSEARVAELVIARMTERFAADPPVLPGAVETVRTMAARCPVAIASSSPPVLLDSFRTGTGLAGTLRVAVSSEQVGAGKPAPDVYLEAARRLGVDPRRCVAVEDSSNGLRSALAAGATVYAVPHPEFPVDPDVLARARDVLRSVADLPAALDADPPFETAPNGPAS